MNMEKVRRATHYICIAGAGICAGALAHILL